MPTGANGRKIAANPFPEDSSCRNGSAWRWPWPRRSRCELTSRRLNVPFKSGMIGAFDTHLAHEFFQGFANHAFVTLHIDNLRGENAHHQCETVFKAFARALRAAVEIDPRQGGALPSTKGTL